MSIKCLSKHTARVVEVYKVRVEATTDGSTSSPTACRKDGHFVYHTIVLKDIIGPSEESA
jgi:hypothetical protein